MNRHASWLAGAAIIGRSLSASSLLHAQDVTQPAAAAFDKLKAMAGDWIDVDGSIGMKDQAAASTSSVRTA